MADISLNIEGNSGDLVKNLNEIKNGFSSLGDESKEFSKQVNKGFSDASKGTKNLTQEQKKQNAILEQTEKELIGIQKAQKKVTNTTSVKKYNKELDETQKKAGGLGSTFRKLGGILLAAFGTQQIIAFGKASIDAFRQQEAAVAKVRQGIESTNAAARGLTLENLQKEASELQKTTLFGDEEILNNATAQLLTFTNIGGEEFSRTTKVALDLATVLDGDVKSATIQIGKALNDPVANLSALSRSGIQFTKQQKEQVKALVESGKQVEAQNLILEELERQYGGQAEAAAAADGGLTQLGNAFGDVQELIGKTLVEALQPFIKSLKEFFESLSQEDIDNFLGTLATIGKVLLPIVGVVAAYQAAVTAVAVASRVAAAAQKVWAVATKGFVVAQKIATAAQLLFNAALNANPVGLIVVGVLALGAALGALAIALADNTKELTEQEKFAKEVANRQNELSAAYLEESKNVNESFAALKNKNTSQEEQLKIIKKLEEQYGVYLDDLKNEKGLLEDLEVAQKRVNDAVIDGIVAKQDAQFREEQLAKVAANALSIEQAKQGVIDENIKQSGLLQEAAEFIVSDGQGITPQGILSGGLEFASDQFIKSDEELAAAREERARQQQLFVIKRLEDENKAIADALNDRAKVSAAAADNLRKALEGVDVGADIDPGGAGLFDPEKEKVRTEAQKKAAEQRRKSRIEENNALFKLEQDFIKAIDDLNDAAESARVDELEGSDRIEAQKKLALQEIDILEDGLKRKLAQIELERTTTKEELSKLSNAEREARLNAIQETVQLADSQQSVLSQLRVNAIKKANDELIKFIREEEQRIAKAESDAVASRIEAVDLAEEKAISQVEADALGIESEILREQFKEEAILQIRQDSLIDKADLIAQEEQLKIEALERELSTLEGVAGQETEIRREALQQQIENANIARDIALINIQKEQQEIKQQLDAIAQQKTKFNLSEALGLTPEEFDKVKQSLSQIGAAIFDEIKAATDEQLAANEQFIDGINSRIDEQADALEREIALNEAGFASNIEGEKAKLAALQEEREKALIEQEKLRRRQAFLDKLAEVSSLGVAIAQIIASESKKGVIGLAIAAAAIPVLFGIFRSAKQQALEAAGGFFKGGYTGGSSVHEERGPVHGKEFVFDHQKTAKHRDLFEAIHSNDIPKMNEEMSKLLKGTGVFMAPEIADNFQNKMHTVELKTKEFEASTFQSSIDDRLKQMDSKLGDFLSEYKNRESVEQRDGMTIIRKGNTTTYIKHNNNV